MDNSKKTREELVKELEQLHSRVDELEQAIGEGSYLIETYEGSPYLQMKVILESIPDIAWLKDKEGRFVAVNEALCSAHGMKAEELIGKTAFDVTLEDLAKHYAADDKEVMRTRKRKVIEEQWEKKGKGRMWLETIKSPVYNNKNEVIGTSGIARDITVRKQAQEALKASEEKWRSLVENAPDFILMLDCKGKILFINRVVKGDTVKQTVGNSVYNYMPQEHHNLMKQAIEEVLKTKKPVSFEAKAVGPKGSISWYSNRLSPVKHGNKVNAIVQISRDITEHKQMEETITESEKRYRMLFEGASEGIIAVEVESKRFLFANPSLCKMLGYSSEELKQMSVLDIHLKEDLEYVISEFEAQARREKTLAIGIPCLRKDGSILYADINATSVEIDGRLCLVGFFSDVSERKKAEQAVQESEEKYRRLVESLQQEYFFYSHGLDGVFQYISPSIENVLGYTQEQFLTHYSEYLTDNPINREVVERSDLSIQGKLQPPYEVEIFHRDGSIHRLEVSEAPIFDKEGAVIAVEGIAHDITDRWQAKIQLQKARDELEVRVQQRTKELAKAIEELQGEVAERRKVEEKLLVYQKELRSLASELSLAEERLRRKVASNVHDHIGQSLAISKMKVEAIRQSLKKPKEVESMTEVQRLLSEAI
ncbi:MAG: PAS domain-containing protein, partial [Planctomycetota bacterium]